jgi:hypothetical protein
MGAMTTPTPAPLPPAAVVEDADVGPRGVGARERGIVIDGLSSARPLTQPRRQQLDLLLKESGKDIMLLSADSMTPEIVRANVSDSGRMPSASGGVGPDYFVVGEGRLEIWDDHAVFAPSDGRPSVRVEGTGDAGPGGLTAAQIQTVIAQVQNLSQNKLNPAQQKALTYQLQAPGQQMITPAATPQLTASQVTMAMAMPDGSMSINSNTGGWVFDPNGNITSSWSFNATTGAWGTTAAGGGTATVNPFAGFNRGSLALIAAECLASLALAILLLVAGILVLRQSNRGRWLHLVYAWLKIPVAVVGGLGVWWFFSSFITSRGGPPGSLVGFVIMSLIMIGVSVAYPIGLLIALRTRAVREYYASAGT